MDIEIYLRHMVIHTCHLEREKPVSTWKMIEEQISQCLASYHSVIKILYRECTDGPFLFPSHLRHHFDRPLTDLLNMSEDASQCWIETAKEAKRTQRLALKASESSRRCLACFLGKINTPQSKNIPKCE